MGYQVVMVGCVVSTPVATISVCGEFAIAGCRYLYVSDTQGLRSNAPLHGRVLHTIDRQAFVASPAYRTVVDDNILFVASAQSVAVHVFVAGTETYEADNNVVGIDGERITGYTDTTR